MLICGMLKNNYSGYQFEVGTDEAGRGCLSGPVVAAAVILPLNYHNDLLNDSKQLSEAKRKILRPIIEKDALAFGISFIGEKEVDQLNVLQASITGMQRAIAIMSIIPEYIINVQNKAKKTIELIQHFEKLKNLEIQIKEDKILEKKDIKKFHKKPFKKKPYFKKKFVKKTETI